MIGAGEFKTINTLKSTTLPKFHDADLSLAGQNSDQLGLLRIINSNQASQRLPILYITAIEAGRPPFLDQDHVYPTNIGGSRSLFGDITHLSSGSATGVASTVSNMVNERSPAKAGVSSFQLDGDEVESSNGAPVTTQPVLAPKFGEPTMPQSPLNRKALESKVFIMPKAARPAAHAEQRQNHPHLHAAKEFVKGVVDPFLSRKEGHNTSTHIQPFGTAVPIPRPSDDISYIATQPVAPKTFGSMGSTYGGFQTVNKPDRLAKLIDLTTVGYRDSLSSSEPYTFVDPSKAAADLKALLEGAIEDEDEMPRTRSRKRRNEENATGLVAKVKGLAVTADTADDEDDEDDDDDGTVEGIKVKLLPHQVEGLAWMRDRELGTRRKGVVPKGGILADDMGLGKTLQSISLLLTNPKPSSSELEDGKRKFPASMEKCTLVVAPLALIRQWELEIKDKVADSHQLRVCVHHGPQRTKRFQDLKKYDVVITTYQILVSEYGSSSVEVDGLKVGCFGLHWYRVILDEAHTIKNRNAKATQACYALRSEYRWCLTGTPMQNNLDELQSLIKFLGIKPYDDLREWKDQIDRPMKNGRGDLAIKRLQHYLKIFMKRRTKDILKKEGALNPGGKPSVTDDTSGTGFRVTERKIEKVFAVFSPEERLFYDRLEKRADKSLEEMMDGQKVNYASALVLLLRLRQACNHPKLVAGKMGKDNEALGIEGAGRTQVPRKGKASDTDVDEMADLFGGLGVGTKKCDTCGNNLSRELSKASAIRCTDCEEDLKLVNGKNGGKKKSRHYAKPNQVMPVTKLRNRNVILDSDDEDENEEEGEWIVGDRHRGPTRLGKAGGIEDENAEGEGISLNSEDSDEIDEYEDSSGNRITNSSTLKRNETKKIVTISDDSGSETDSDVEASLNSSSEEESHLATIMTSAKIKHLLRILGKEATKHKFIVFSQFTSMLDLIEPFLKRDGYKYTRYDGSMKNDLREASLNRLRNETSCRVLLCSLKCGSLGLNLTAATRVVILEPFWNPFVEEQAIDRVHRLTQKKDVVVYKITIENSVEERILNLQEKKRELANQAIEGGAKAGAGKLGMKEILQLFRRDAEHAPPTGYGASAGIYGAPAGIYGAQPAVLRKEVLPGGGREGSAGVGSRSEDNVYGRRW